MVCVIDGKGGSARVCLKVMAAWANKTSHGGARKVESSKSIFVHKFYGNVFTCFGKG